MQMDADSGALSFRRFSRESGLVIRLERVRKPRRRPALQAERLRLAKLDQRTRVAPPGLVFRRRRDARSNQLVQRA